MASSEELATQQQRLAAVTSVEEECVTLKQFLEDVLKDRDSLKKEFDELSASSQNILQTMEDEDSDMDDEDDDTLAEEKMQKYQLEKKKLDEKLRDLEKRLSEKDREMSHLDEKASEYLLRVTTNSNYLFDAEEKANEKLTDDSKRETTDKLNIDKENKSAEETLNADQVKQKANQEIEMVLSTSINSEPSGNFDNKMKIPELKINGLDHEISNNANEVVPLQNETVTPDETDPAPIDKEIVIVETSQSSSTPEVKCAVSDVTNSEIPSLVSSNPADQMVCLSALVTDLKKVKDEMGKCMTVKEKSFVEIESELSSAKKEQNLLKDQISSVMNKLEDKEDKFKTLAHENEQFKLLLDKKSEELKEASSKSSDLAREKNELEGRLKVLEVMMVEYRAEIETVTGEKTQVEEQAKQFAKEMSAVNEKKSEDKFDDSDAEMLENISGDEQNSLDLSSTDNLNDKSQDEPLDENYTLLMKENQNLSKKLKSTSKYLKALARDREIKREECSVLQEKVQQVEGKMFQLQSTFDTLVSAVMAERDDLVKECANKSTEINRLSNLLKQHQSKEKNLNEKINKLNNKEQTTSNALASLEQQIKSTQEKFDKCVLDYEDRITSMKIQSELDESENKKQVNELKNMKISSDQEVTRLNEQVKTLEARRQEEALNASVAEKLKAKEEECKILEGRLDEVNADTSQFTESLKEEMSRMKEDMIKLGEARLQLEVSNDSLSEEHQELIVRKQELESSNAELTSSQNELKEQIDSLKGQVDELTTKNVTLSCDFHEKEEELNDELKAREATIKELGITLINNQKQSNENYKGLQEDMTISQLKVTKQIDEYKNSLKQMEEKISKLTEENEQLQSSLNDSTDANNLKSEEINSLKIQLEKAPPVHVEKDVGKNDATTETDSEENSRSSGACSPEIITAWSGSLEELECDLSLAKDELIKFGERKIATDTDEKSNEKKIKIASMVRRVEELSGLLAATRIRRGVVPGFTESTCVVLANNESESNASVNSVSAPTTSTSSANTVVSQKVFSEDKQTGTWTPFATQKEFEEFVAEKEKVINDLEEKVKSLEDSLNNKSVYINELEVELENTKEEVIEFRNKAFEEHLEDVNKLNRDITKLKEDLESSRSECSDLKNTITSLEVKKSEFESEKVELVKEIEQKVLNALPVNKTNDDTLNESPDVQKIENSDAPQKESEDPEVKKNLDEQLKLTLSQIESRIVVSFTLREKYLNKKINLIDASYSDKILSIKEEYDKKINSLENEINSPANQSAYFSEKIRILEQNIEKLRVLVVEMEEQKAIMEERMKVTENKVGVLNEVKRKLMEYTKSLEEKLHTTDKQCNQSIEEKNSTVQQAESLAAENSLLQNNIKSLNEKIDSMIVKETQQENILKENDNVREKLTSKIVQLEDEVTKLKQQVEVSCAASNDANKEKEATLKQIKEFEVKFDFLNNQIELLNKEKSAMETLNTDLAENLLTKESNCIANNFKCDELLEINTFLKGDVDNLNKQVSTLSLEKQELSESINNLKNELKQKIEVNDRLEKEVLDKNQALLDVYKSQQKCNINQSGVSNEQTLESLKNEVKKLMEEKNNICKKHEDEQQKILEMQNMMVSDMEKLILTLESDKTSLEEKIINFEKEKHNLTEENSNLNKMLSSIKIDGGDSRSFIITEQLLGQIKELQQKLSKAQEDMIRKDIEWQEKVNSIKGGNSQKLLCLRQDMKEEMDILESRKEEETEELCEKFAHLEVEFTSKLAEMKEYYEVLLSEEKAEFGRVLVLKMDDYETKISEKNDEIMGWETKLISMQQELDDKMIVIEELEERLDDNISKASPRQLRKLKFTSIASAPNDGASSSSNCGLKQTNSSIGSKLNRPKLESTRSLDIALSDFDIPTRLSTTKEAPTEHKPILSLVIPSTYSEVETAAPSSGDNQMISAPIAVPSTSISSYDHIPRVSSPTSSISSSTSSAFTRVGKSASVSPIRTAVFVSRDFPSDSALQSFSPTSDNTIPDFDVLISSTADPVTPTSDTVQTSTCSLGIASNSSEVPNSSSTSHVNMAATLTSSDTSTSEPGAATTISPNSNE